MLCTKCGQEYEGSQCPRCDGPVILVNNSDYLARRKAYEEKQALKERSASSDKKEESQSDYGQALAKRVQAIKKQSRNKTESKKQSSGKTGNKKQSQNRSKADSRKQSQSKAGGGRNDNQEKPQIRIARRQINKRMKMIAAALIAVVLIGVAAFGIYKLATKKNYALYVSYNGKIYDIAGLDSNYVCDESNAIFAADSKTFYTAQWPEQIDSEKNILSVASDNGKYFVTVTYDESNLSGRYSMYIWSRDECVLVSEDNLQKEIMYISDDGLVIYTNINIINDEGSTNGTSLAMSRVKEVKKQPEAQTTLIEGNLNKAYVYESKHLIVCLTNAGSLYTYDYEKKEKPVSVADAVMQLWPVSENMPGVYTANADSLNTRKDVDTLLYSKSDGVYYYSCKDASAYKIDKKTDNDADYVFDRDNSLIYRISGTSMTSALIRETKVSEYVDVDSMTKEKNYIYYSSDGQIVYVNAKGQLRVVDNNKITDIASDVNAGSLSKVYNKSKALTYVSGGRQYYMDNIKSKAVAILESDAVTDTEGTYFYKNRIYAYDADNILYSNTLKGNDISNIGYVERLWLGTELR